MTRNKNTFRARASRLMWWRDQSGSSTVEFVIWFPLFMTLFLTSFELSYYGLRSVFLERAVDMTVREMRLGISRPQNTGEFKTQVCEKTLLEGACEEDLMVELILVDQSTWSLPTGSISCIDRNDPMQPLPAFGGGGSGDLMLLRVCWLKRPFFATTPLVMGLPRDVNGEIALSAVSTYVNEP
ncbi:TadE/TadG family type IV pilus assembly protein [Aliiroseovarius sp. S253]|uniref:TadE/TadG family type IV pilus assembly protein n=1 Tax=Aliiroseovarius sp. S253 TaxID=3415133 RepID=UPI003C7CAE7D